jgi:pimeloyl-ACP methyl ester carboxylesterase
VLCPDYPSFGDAADYDFKAAFASGRYKSGTMKGVFNHMRCVDYLQSRDDVDPKRIGVIGHSLGGHNAMFVAAFDERIGAAVSSCGWTPFADYYKGDLKGWTSDRYMPAIRDEYKLDPKLVPFDFYEIVAALAPRPFFSCSPTRDSNFEVEGVRKAERAVRPVYELLGAGDALQVRYPDAAHDFPNEVREEAYKFLDRALKP